MLLEKAGRPAGEADAFVRALSEDYQSAPLSASDRAMLDYAVKLTHAPASIRADDIARLRQAGFDDVAIHDICAVTAYFAFANRMADGLGVELEPGRASGPSTRSSIG